MRHPLLFYYRAYARSRLGASRAADIASEVGRDLAEGAASSPVLDILPFRREEVAVLEYAARANPRDAVASYLLGSLLWALGRKAEALSAWRQACAGDRPEFVAFRALGLAEIEQDNFDAGLRALARAVELAPEDISTGLLLAQFYAQRDRSREAEAVLERLPADEDRVVERRAALEAQQGRWAQAAELLRTHTFQPQHLSRSLLNLYREIHLGWGAEEQRRGEATAAAAKFAAAAEPPAGLGADDFPGPPGARVLVFQQRWELAAASDAADPEETFFRAVALARLGRGQQARPLLEAVRESADRLEQSAKREGRALGLYLRGLLARHAGQDAAARDAFRRALAEDATLLSARVELARLP